MINSGRGYESGQGGQLTLQLPTRAEVQVTARNPDLGLVAVCSSMRRPWRRPTGPRAERDRCSMPMLGVSQVTGSAPPRVKHSEARAGKRDHPRRLLPY